jgi:hypothetical protein
MEHKPAEVIQSYVDRIDALEAPDTDGVLTQELLDLLGPEASIPMLEGLVSEFKRRRDAILEVDIPNYLSEQGVTEFTLENGYHVSKKRFYTTKTLDKNKVAEWLREIGHDEIITDSFAFKRGEVKLDLVEYLKEKGYSYKRDADINGASLKKVVVDYLEAPLGDGEPMHDYPRDALQVKPYTQAVIKRPNDKSEF